MIRSAPQLLIVEDEPAVAALIATSLRIAQYEVTLAQDAQQARAALAHTAFDAAVIDWMLPAESGVSLIASLRQQAQYRQLPILMLTAKALEDDKVAGLEAGADDYLSKPFSPKELAARIKALLRRAQPMRGDSKIVVGAVTLDPVSATVVFNSPASAVPALPATVALSSTEFKLLHALMLQPQRVHSRERLLSQVWGDNEQTDGKGKGHQIDVRTIDAHIKRLRQALLAVGCADYIHTVRGVGYALSTLTA